MRPDDYSSLTSFEDHLSPFGTTSEESWEAEEEDQVWDESADTETEWELDGEVEAEQLRDPSDEALAWGETGEAAELEWEDEHTLEDRELDPVLVGFTERMMSREAGGIEHESRSKWTTCFTARDIAKVEQVYKDNAVAAGSNSTDRCSCIVMLNVALGQLLPLKTKQHPARSTSVRKVEMATLTTQTIEKAMAQLQKLGMAIGPKLMNFLDRRGRTAGTLKPEKLKASVQKAILARSTKECWSAFGFSIMDGYHSVLLLVDRTGTADRMFWLDQFSSAIDDDVTTTLDQRVTDKTQGWWQAVKDKKNVGYRTTIRIWQLRKKKP